MRLISSSNQPKGTTLLELMFVMAILALLATLTITGLNYYTRRSQDVACMGNLRGLHAGFAAYLNENGQVWPQNPLSAKEDSNEDQELKFWVEALKPFGPHRQTWLCPADRQGTAKDTDEEEYDITYYPTPFDEEPGTAYKWMHQPWLVERGGSHGKNENNVVMPDGSIQKRAF
jgi:prepilin-type N-terminal cleavage/methylation domain-containing protein